MKNLLSRVGAIALALLLPCASIAQAPVGKSIQAPAGYLTAEAIYCDDGTGHAGLCSFGGGAATITSRISYTATASGTGYSAGDQLDRIVTTSPTSTTVNAFWVNVTAGGLLTGAPAAANITLKPETLTNTTFAVTQGTSPWVVSGQVADGVAPANPAIHVAGVDGSGLKRTLLTDGGGRLQVDIVIKAASTDRGAIVGTTAIPLAPINATRRGWAVQVQGDPTSTVACYFNGSTAATTDYHSLQVSAGGYWQTPDGHVGTGAISAICNAAGVSIYMREW